MKIHSLKEVIAITIVALLATNVAAQNTVKRDMTEIRGLSSPDMAWRWAFRTGIEADSLYTRLTGECVCSDSLEHFTLVCYAEDIVREKRLLDKKRRSTLSKVVKRYWKERVRNGANITEEERETARAIRHNWSRDETIEAHRRDEFFRRRTKYMDAHPKVGRIHYYHAE